MKKTRASSTKRMRLRSPAGRAWLLVTLSCWLWLAFVTPFGHTCLEFSREDHAVVAAAVPPCASCEWQACTSTVVLAPPPPIALAQVPIQQHVPPATSGALSAPVLLLSPRAPPA